MCGNQSSKHCHLRGRRLWGRGWIYAPNGVPDEQVIVVCRRCQETAVSCDVCGVPMGPNHIRLSDGRRICARCHQTAIYDPVRVQALFEHVIRVAPANWAWGSTEILDFALNPAVDKMLSFDSPRPDLDIFDHC